MTGFQIITLIISGLLLLGSIVGVYVKSVIEITKLQVDITNIRREINQKEITSLHVEGINREDHKEILKKIDELILRK